MEETGATRGDGWRLFGLGFLTLFLELALIRYLGANIWNLGYFPNLVLIAVFLGMGLGFVFQRLIAPGRSPWLFLASMALLTALVLFVQRFHPSLPGISSKQENYAGEFLFLYSPTKGEDTRLLPFLMVFLGVTFIFALIAQKTARLFGRFHPLTAYTLDIAGSCAGIVAFMIAIFARTSPWVWFAVIGVLFALLSQGVLSRAAVLACTVAIVSNSLTFDGRHLRYPDYKGEIDVIWSPYQRVEYINSPQLPATLRGTIWVNGIGHQRVAQPGELESAIYHMPYDDRQAAGLPPAGNVLIIGAGSGNDTATALLRGVEHVDAVEIDPAIADLGRRHHPYHPYDDPRVNLVIDDGRAFMANTTRRYDIVMFAWADSLVRLSSVSQLRLENYLYTEQSMKRAFELLTDTGTVYLFNSIPNPVVGAKYFAMIQKATGVTPIVISETLNGFHKFKFGKTPAFQAPPAPVDTNVFPPSDDWPFPHIEKPVIPPFYRNILLGMAAFLTAMFALVHFAARRDPLAGAPGMASLQAAFALMGAAFLLLETKSVIQFSLLFGATWLNSSLVFLGILVLVLAANWAAVVIRTRRALPVVFALLIVSSLLPLAFPLANLLTIEARLPRFLAASALTFSPIFFANLIFSLAFRDQKAPAHVFGFNLLGAMGGGVLEYSSMMLGFNRLVIVVAILYAAAFFFLLRARVPALVTAETTHD